MTQLEPLIITSNEFLAHEEFITNRTVHRVWTMICVVVGACIGVAIGFFIFGCAPAIPRSAVHVRPTTSRAIEPGGLTDADCLTLMDLRDNAQLTGKILAGVGGVSALATAPDSIPEAGRWGIGAGAATAAMRSARNWWRGHMDQSKPYWRVRNTEERGVE